MKDLITSILMLIVLTVALGVLYPLAVWGVSQAVFPYQANGSLIERDGKVVGSALIGQNFTTPGYFHGRPSAAGNGYDASASSGSNLGPTSDKLIKRIQADTETIATENPDTPIPADLVTTSASGLDPHISPAAAEFQVPRVAKERHISEAELRNLVTKHTEGRQVWFLGEPRVNVLLLNLDLDSQKPLSK
ncbi:MAG TPA: potassium-transporting ATPase subunit KdpC [Pyrinomonadaceae bacterium]|jgi:K+-transporting ATPase ATPase C chain|nr:potassium-transporting ATPase subunit KdpC [Pyrinomonadaceae bacterium]